MSDQDTTENIIFVDPMGIKNHPSDYIKSCIFTFINNDHREYNRDKKYHFPCFAVCQSSGYGKTKTFLELSDDFFIFYISFGKDGRSGEDYEPWTPSVYNSILSFKREDNYYGFLGSCVASLSPDVD